MSRHFLLALLLACALPAGGFGGIVEKVSPQVGKAAAPVRWLDETGRAHQLSEFAGYPLVLLPVYTRCRTACVTNVSQLKAALAETKADPTQFRVLLFSFDDTDTPAVLRNFRLREKIPLSWSLGTSSQKEISALLESIGYQYGQAGREFIHPNLLFFLDRDLRIARWIYGDSYSGPDMDRALQVAAGESDWLGRHFDLLYSFLVFGASLSAVALSYYLLQLVALRRTRPTTAES